MRHDFYTNLFPAMRQTQSGGLPVCTNLRGGACVDVNEQVKSALQTLTTALGGPASVPASPAPLLGARQDPATMTWWAQNPAAWATCRTDPQPPATVMQAYAAWLKALPGTPIFVGYPVGFDFMFVYWYLLYFVGESPFARRALDVRTFAMAQLQRPYLAVARDQLPTHYCPDLPHTHQAIDDALEQGAIFCTLLQENLQTHRELQGETA